MRSLDDCDCVECSLRRVVDRYSALVNKQVQVIHDLNLRVNQLEERGSFVPGAVGKN